MLLSPTTVDVLATIMATLSFGVMLWVTFRQLMNPVQPKRQRFLVGIYLALLTMGMICIYIAIWEPRVLRQLYGYDW
jgi:hypothetical protein